MEKHATMILSCKQNFGGKNMSNVRRVYVEKKPDFAVKAKELSAEVKGYLGIKTVTNVRVLVRYDIENISEDIYKNALMTVFSEPPVDNVYEETFEYGDAHVFSVEYLPGQFDQRANSLSECLQILTEGARPISKSAKIYVLKGKLSAEDVEKIKSYIINPVDSRECSLDKLESLDEKQEEPADVAIVEGFINMTDEDSKEFSS